MHPAPPSILFLDIDGVLNTQSGASHPGAREEFSQAAVLALSAILDETGCRIVISSSWREDLMDRIPVVFEKNGLGGYTDRIIGETPVIREVDECIRRGEEIAAWLDANPRAWSRFVILDDDTVAAEQRAFHVRTNMETGLTCAQAVEARRILLGAPTRREGSTRKRPRR